MRHVIISIFVILLAVPAFAADEPKTEEQKTLYAIGQIMARQLSVFNLAPAEFELVQRGLSDGMKGNTSKVDLEVYRKKTQELATTRRDTQGEKLAADARSFIDKAAAEKGAVRTASSAIYRSLKDGNGSSPTATDSIKVNYRGTLINGKEFDSSYLRGEPGEFNLNNIIKCLSDGAQMMKPGGKASLVCPPETAYGKNASGMIPPNATLIFEVELLEVVKKKP